MPGTGSISWMGNAQTNPLDIIKTVSPFWFLLGDLGITLGTGVSAWADQSGNGVDFTQATGGDQPTYIASDSDFGNRGSLLGDGAGDYLISTLWEPPAPLTTNIWFFAVIRQVSFTAGRYIWNGSGATTLYLAQTGTTPNLSQLNASSSINNANAPIGTSVRVEEFFSGSTNDYLKLGSTSVTGINSGNANSAASFALFGRSNGATTSNSKIACVGAWAGKPTDNELTALDSWVTSYYAGTVAI